MIIASSHFNENVDKKIIKLLIYNWYFDHFKTNFKKMFTMDNDVKLKTASEYCSVSTP